MHSYPIGASWESGNRWCALGANIAGLRTFPALSAVGVENPSTQHALWVRLHGDDRGLLFDRETQVRDILGDAFAIADAVDTFRYREGRDLSGYEDGTENPKGEATAEAALVASGEGLEGSRARASSRCNAGCTVSTAFAGSIPRSATR